MTSKEQKIRVLRFENPWKAGTQKHRGFKILMGMDGQTYGDFRKKMKPIQAKKGKKPFSPSTVKKEAQELGYLELIPPQRGPVEAPPHQSKSPNKSTRKRPKQKAVKSRQVRKESITLREPLHKTNVVVVKGVNPHKPGIYVFIVGDKECEVYVGKYEKSSRFAREYSSNVKKLLDGGDYRPKNPNGFRAVHRALADAVKSKSRITLVILENREIGEDLEVREKQLIPLIGTLNRT